MEQLQFTRFQGGANAAYTTIVGLTVNQRTTTVCNKVSNEQLLKKQ